NGYEDTDFCLRAQQLGFRIVYTPHSQIIHHVSASESRFDRDPLNHAHFKARWADRINSTEIAHYRQAGFLPKSEPTSSNPIRSTESPRIGLLSNFNQTCAYADFAGHLVDQYSSD